MLTRQKGFGIVELLIGIAVGMIVVGAAVQLLFTTLRNSNDSIKMARLEQDLRQTMQMVSRDLRRATSWDATVDVAKVALAAPLTLSANTGNDVAVTSSVAGALSSIGSMAEGGTLIHVDSDGNVHRAAIKPYGGGDSITVDLAGTWPAYAKSADGVDKGSWNILRPQSVVTMEDGSCVVFVYDSSLNGAYASNEHYGYRHNDDGDAVEVRYSYSGASPNSCTGGSWEKLTDDNFVEVTEFGVTGSPVDVVTSTGLNVSIREYTIRITGQLKADDSISRTLQETIRVRNDRVY